MGAGLMIAREDEALVSARRPALRSAPSRFIALSLAVELAALASAVTALALDSGSLQAWGKAAFVLALALGFDEVSRRAARLRIRLSEQLSTDMTSVWAIAASAALPRGVAVVVLFTVLAYDWFRHHRPAGESLHRKLYVIATILLGCVGASLVSRQILGHALTDRFGHATSPVLHAITVLSAILVYTAVQRALVTAGLMSLGIHGRVLLGSRDDNLIELATLCLGGLVALALIYEPLLAVLALAPMITMHRGALVRELETVAITDAKTGLLNAVALEHLGEREVARAERGSTMLAVLIADIDHFKLVNDRHGHMVGDSVLRGVGKALTAGVREYDTVGRFGGEEFVAILPSADQHEAMVIAERLRDRVAALRIAELDPRVDPASTDGLTVSIGVACLGADGAVMTELLFAADAALYLAKAAGRNRVVLAERAGDGPEREISPS